MIGGGTSSTDVTYSKNDGALMMFSNLLRILFIKFT